MTELAGGHCHDFNIIYCETKRFQDMLWIVLNNSFTDNQKTYMYVY